MEDETLGVMGIEAIGVGSAPRAKILLYRDVDGRLVHYRHLISYNDAPPDWDESPIGDYVERYPSETGAREISYPSETGARELMRYEGVVYLEGGYGVTEEAPFPVPPGPVQMALEYSDGIYSNFVPIWRQWSDGFYPEEEEGAREGTPEPAVSPTRTP
jgi:hypothetical protein